MFSLVVIILILGVVGYSYILSLLSYNKSHQNSFENIGCFYLTDVNISLLKDRGFKILILEFNKLSSEDVSTLHKSNGLVLGYINFGYAEDWRDYWSLISNFSWVHGESMYKDEYYIEFWNPQWHEVILSEIATARDKGLDGVLLDNIDVYSVLEKNRSEWVGSFNLTNMMINSIHSVSDSVKKRYGSSFKMYVNIGSAYELLYNKTFLDSVDGLVVEELLHHYTDGKSVRICICSIKSEIDILKHAFDEGKTVVVSDPVSDADDAKEFCGIMGKLGFLPIPQPVWAWDYSQPPPRNWCVS